MQQTNAVFFLFFLALSPFFPSFTPPECIPQAFSIVLPQVIANDRTHRQRQDSYRQDPPQREDHKDSSDLVSSILQVCQSVLLYLGSTRRPFCTDQYLKTICQTTRCTGQKESKT